MIVDRASKRDITLSAVVPLYGAIAGLIALVNGMPRRGRTMRYLSTANGLLIVAVMHWLR
jgi:hypothetical protein